MHYISKAISILGITLLAALMTAVAARTVDTRNVDIRISEDFINVSAELIFDSLRLGSNRQLLVTPVLRGAGDEEKELPSVLVNGRNMHYSYLRGSLDGFPALKEHVILRELRDDAKSVQSVDYSVRTPLDEWMLGEGTRLVFVVDSCGCGTLLAGADAGEYLVIPPFENPVKEMRAVMIRPPYTEPPVTIHEGRARVQFEVDRTELHVNPYTCRNGQRIDNRAQIAMIDDSVKYALTDPNVELSAIEICGYASPESPYTHNDELATGRSRALA